MNAYQYEPCFSMHTFEVRMRCSIKEDYYLAYERLKWHCKKYKKPMYAINKNNYNTSGVNNMDINLDLCDSNGGSIEGVPFAASKDEIVCEALTERGITVKFVRCKLGMTPVYYGVWMIINPRRFLGDNTYVGIFHTNRVDDLLEGLYWTLVGIGIGHLSLDRFRLHRIDMCRNVFLGSQNMVETYIELLKKCFVPQGYTWNEIGGVEYAMRLKDGVKVATDALAIVAYNKKAQMIKQDGYYNIIDIEEAEGLLRFEIQLYEGRIRHLCRMDNSLYNLRNFLLCCEVLSLQHFEQYIPRVFLKGNYFTLEDAKNIVEQSDYYQPTKKKMLMLLDSVSTHRNLMTALNEVCRRCRPTNPYNFTRDLIQSFDDIYLNPITIPRRWDTEGGMFLSGAYNQVMGIDTLLFSVGN